MRRDPALLILAAGQTLAWACIFYVFPALLLRWEQALGWSKADLTAAIAGAVLVSAAASPIAGRIIDRGQGARLMAVSAAAGGVGLLLLSFVSELWQFYAVWVLLGLAMGGCLYDPCFAILTRARGIYAKRGIILITLVAGFASTISFPAMHSLSDWLGWRGAVQVGAGVMLIVVAPVLWRGVTMLEAGGIVATEPEPEIASGARYLRRPAFWFLSIGFACLAMTHGAILHHLLPILDERGYSGDLAVLAASFIGPMQVAGRLAMMAADRFVSNNGVALGAFAVMGLSVVFLALAGSSPAFLSLFVILFGSAFGTVSILRPVLTREILGPNNFGAKSGAVAVSFLAGSALAPFLGALIWTTGGYDLMLAVAMVLLILGGGLYTFAQRLARRS